MVPSTTRVTALCQIGTVEIIVNGIATFEQIGP